LPRRTRRPLPGGASLSAADLGVEILGADALAREGDAWDDLAARAVEPHPHYSRHVVAAHRAAGLVPKDLAIVIVRQGGRPAALLPFSLGLDLTGFGTLVGRPFASPYVTSTAPLVADGPDFARTLDALVAGLTEASNGRAWRWPLLSTERRTGAWMIAAMRAAGWQVAVVEAFERPVLTRLADHDAYLRAHPSRNRLKDLRRRERRLAERGTVIFETATAGEPLREALDAFLRIEASGWKGEAGTALASRPATKAFAHALFREGDGPVGVRADGLRLDGRLIAVSLSLLAGGTATLLKTAYDETERACAPGLVLEAEIVRRLHATGFAERLDSATLAGSALESFYRERETVAEIVAVPPGGHRLVGLDRRVALARFEHRARAEAKRWLKR